MCPVLLRNIDTSYGVLDSNFGCRLDLKLCQCLACSLAFAQSSSPLSDAFEHPGETRCLSLDP